MMIDNNLARHLRRLGGELPSSSDRTGPKRKSPENWLFFSNGRAALAWMIERCNVRSVILCAYTCPVLPPFFRKLGLAVGIYDVAATEAEIASIALSLPSPRLVLVPALFGSAPLMDVRALSAALDNNDYVTVDAAQSAFGHEEYSPPLRGGVLSCLRKTTSLTDGSILVISGTGKPKIDGLPTADASTALKKKAREIWATGDADLERQALDFNAQSEANWPNTPHRITPEALEQFEILDRAWHVERRRRNRALLLKKLSPVIPFWLPDNGTPYSLPVFVTDAASVMKKMHARRIFVSRLWPDTEHEPALHTAAAWMAEHLISLPIDQQCDEADIARIATAINEIARPAPIPPQSIRQFVGTTSN
ncbi:MAG TPA: hypothetical protein VHD59_12410 [Pseudolabrys sp.]|nr:hypothetical protein [Pseudolabrys sp.]